MNFDFWENILTDDDDELMASLCRSKTKMDLCHLKITYNITISCKCYFIKFFTSLSRSQYTYSGRNAFFFRKCTSAPASLYGHYL